jgi:hypothetical protein
MAPVAIAKLIFVQLPVKRGLFPSKLAVIGEPESLLVAMESTGPVTVETKELDPMSIFADIVELDIAGALVDAEPEPSGPRMIELVSPSGEQPTNDGAVSLTVAHSWILNNIASGRLLGLFWRQERSLYTLCWSEVSQFVARQQDRVLTYSAFEQRHFTSRLEQLPADAVELLKQVCCTDISLDSNEHSEGEPTAQAGRAFKF